MKKRKLILTLLLVIGLVSITLGVSIAFFNYTRTGSNNTVATGRIYFNTTQDGNISLTNIFPVDSEDIDNVLETGNNVTINIEGDTTYNYGVEYLVTAEDVNIEVNNKKIPVNLYVTSTSNLGNNDDSYFENRGGNTSLYKVLSGGVVHEGQYLLVGYIAKGQEGIEGSLNIKAYIDKDKIAITDTYDGTESDNMGTTNNWVNGRTVFTTSEWNSLSTSGSSLSFKIRVEANEGVWVDPYTTPNLMNYINFNRNAVNVKEIIFIEETPLRMQRRYDASVGSESNGTKLDLTYQDTGKVLAWIEPISVSPTGTNNELLNVKPKFLFNEEQEENNIEQIDNETSYILYIASSGKTKWVTGSGLFAGFTNVEKITFENVDSSDVTSMSNMFYSNTNITSIDLSGLGGNALANIENMFSGCTNLSNINMENFNFGLVTNFTGVFSSLSHLSRISLSGSTMNNVENMGGMFYGLSGLTSINLSGIGSNKLTSISGIFNGCINLISINMSGFNFGNITSLDAQTSPFANNSTVQNVILSNANTSNITSMNGLFMNCWNLESVDLTGINTSNVIDMSNMFWQCRKLRQIDMRGLDTSKVTDMKYFADRCALLENIYLDGLNLSLVTNMTYMFRGTILETIDFSSVQLGTISSSVGMFEDCVNLTRIYASSNWVFANSSDTSMMFYGCTSLVGGNGTVFDSSKTDKTMAVIDTPGAPGYLTLKNA